MLYTELLYVSFIFSASLDIDEKQQKTLSSSITKRKSKSDWISSEEWKKPKGFTTLLNKESLWSNAVYEIGPPSWIRKQVNANTRTNALVSVTISLLNKIKFLNLCLVGLWLLLDVVEVAAPQHV